MTRYRWFQADWPVPIRVLAKRVRQRIFSDEQSSGFILDRVRDDVLEARYVERYEYTETVSDPFGKQLTFDRVDFRQTSFRATGEWPGLELIDPPRTCQSLVNQLLEATDFELPITPLSVSVLAWSDAFQKAVGAPTLVDSIQLGSLQLEEGVQAKVVVKSERDVQGACHALVDGRRHVLEKLRLRVIVGHTRLSVVLTTGGSSTVEGLDVPEEVVSALRCSIPRAT